MLYCKCCLPGETYIAAEGLDFFLMFWANAIKIYEARRTAIQVMKNLSLSYAQVSQIHVSRRRAKVDNLFTR